MLINSVEMFSRGKCDVKYNPLKSESEGNASNKRICAPKIFYFFTILFLVTFIIFIYLQDYFKIFNAKFEAPIMQKNESKDTDLPNPSPSTHLPSVQTPHVDHTSTSPPAPKACGVQVKDGPVIKVRNLHTYVTGSYMDYRFGGKQIKTIAIVLREEQVKYSCVMCCDGRNVTSPAEYTIHYDHFGFEYGTATITCHINSPCSIPTHVAITAREISESITSFLPVRNRDVPAVFPYQFTVCISVMYDYKNVLNLVESMEMFRLLGAQRVAIYKTNCDSDTQKVLDYYVKRGFVEIIPWTIKNHIKVSSGWRKDLSPGELHYYGQIPALNDCIYRYMYQSHYVALHDLDELILPLKVKTWTELLPELEKMYGTTVGFEFENNVFSFTAKAHTDYKQDKWKNVPGWDILNYIERIPNDPKAFNNYKIIVSPRLALKATVHGLLETVNPGPSTVRVSNSIARMYHSKYFEYPQNTNLIRDDHLWDYAKDLIPAVSKVLQDCGFTEA
ncbi:uncharacterized protein LOC125254303 [Megalobrama amblycephala]|uniref:uncharacterized protein LOC125254303 n=1 Tax=Megalobrama amblycephala TaxID=75352 RepID=UPI002013D6F5|nr:uncharacterized protein LOC125254303 [Megalobrama amblycephala]